MFIWTTSLLNLNVCTRRTKVTHLSKLIYNLMNSFFFQTTMSVPSLKMFPSSVQCPKTPPFPRNYSRQNCFEHFGALLDVDWGNKLLGIKKCYRKIFCEYFQNYTLRVQESWGIVLMQRCLQKHLQGRHRQ